MVEEGNAVRWAGKCFPRWADLDQASSGEPEPPEEVAGEEMSEIGSENGAGVQSCSGG